MSEAATKEDIEAAMNIITDVAKACEERDQLRADNTRLEAELEKARHNRNAEGMRVRGELLPKLTKLTEVVKACEVKFNALKAKIEYCSKSQNIGSIHNSARDAAAIIEGTTALIHTLQSGKSL